MDKILSIVIPAYNYGSRLAVAVESVMVQLSKTDELIIVDDGSTDNTKEVVASLERMYPDTLLYIHKENNGAASARNVGIQNSNGTYLLFLDADDQLISGALENIYQGIRDNPSVDLFLAGHETANEKGLVKRHAAGQVSNNNIKNVKAYWGKKLAVSHGAFVAKANLFDRIRYPESLKNSEDISVFSHLLATAKTMSLSVSLVRVNKHPDSLRHQIFSNENTLKDLVDSVFDARFLSGELMSCKKDFIVKTALSLSRSNFLVGNYKQTQFWYKRALCLNPLVVFRGAYFRKYVKSLFS